MAPVSHLALLALAAAASVLSAACSSADPAERPDGGESRADGTPADASAGGPDAFSADASGADAVPGDTEGGGFLAADRYCDTVASAYCDYYLRCGRVAAATATECLAYFAAACEENFERRYVALERAGLLRLSAEGVSACAAHLGTVACEQQIRDLDGACAEMWIGTVAEGGPCGIDIESFTCAPGSICVVSLTLCGECKRIAPDGEACGGDVACARDAECSNAMCRERAEVGEACGPDARCVLGASCTGGRCAAPSTVGVGEPCDRERRCPYGSSCSGGTCVLGGRIGEPCSAAAPCAVGRCGAGGRCVALAMTGEACASSLDCAEGPCSMNRCTSLPSACFP